MESERFRNQEDPFFSRPKPLALAFWAVFGAVAIFASTWVGPLAFYWSFERPFLRRIVAVEGGAVSRRPVLLAETRAQETWECRAVGDLCVPVPPGALESFEVEGLQAAAKCEGAEIGYSVFPPGLIRQTYLAQLEAVGGHPDPERLPGDAALLRDIFETTPGLFRFGWDARARSEYAARLTAKMRLVRDWPTVRFEIYEQPESETAAALVEYATGEVTAIAVVRGGTLVVGISGDVPDSWKSSPARWIPSEAAAR